MFINKMSQMVIRESSDSEFTSTDEELDDTQHDELNQINKMLHSGSKVDRRLIELFKVRRADQMGISMSQHHIKDYLNKDKNGEEPSYNAIYSNDDQLLPFESPSVGLLTSSRTSLLGSLPRVQLIIFCSERFFG